MAVNTRAMWAITNYRLSPDKAYVAIFLIVAVICAIACFVDPIVSDNTLAGFTLSSSANMCLQKPWTVFTYAFVQINARHYIVNMLALGASLVTLSKVSSSVEVILAMLLGCIISALMYLLFAYFDQADCGKYLCGLSGVNMALFCFCVFKSKSRATVLLFVSIILVDLIFNISEGNVSTAMAHVGGLFGGMLYVITSRVWHCIIKHKRAHQVSASGIIQKVMDSGYVSLSKSERDGLFRNNL